jgi:hypothetical protein
MDPETLRAWKDQPLTQAFLRYLKDRRQDLMVARARGACLTPEEQAQAVCLTALVGLSANDIARQYGGESDG